MPNAFTWVFSRVLGKREAITAKTAGRPPGRREMPAPARRSGAPARESEPPVVRAIRSRLGSPTDLVVRRVRATGRRARRGQVYWVVFLESLADRQLISEGILQVLGTRPDFEEQNAAGDVAPLLVPEIVATRSVDRAMQKLLDGWVAVFPPGTNVIWLADASGRPSRAVEEPQAETGVRVPREGFTELLDTNVGLLRARIRHPGLRIEERRVGARTGTRVILAYVVDLIDPDFLETVRTRTRRVRIDGIVESGYVEEFIEDSPYSPFPQTLRTERPDVVAANLLEGRFAILTDGTPFALVGPVVLIQLLTVAEDYYERFAVGSLLRSLRLAAFTVSIILPGLYVAISTYHYELVPTSLLLSIASAREAVPFPTLVEVLLMEFQLEVLREAGVRLPRGVGPAVSIVGALVLGQAAISASLVSPATVIVVAMTAISSFATPVFSIAITARMIRFLFTLGGAALGLFGVQAAGVVLLIHLCALRSFGIPYLAPLAPLQLSDWKDFVIRMPWWAMTRRPRFVLPKDSRRVDPGVGPA
ncbi:MAG: spore germination protein [Bacillota bacterium]